MDTFLAIASRREVRDYEPRPLPPEVEERILDAGRLAGNSKNRQPWRFVVVPRDLLADLRLRPENLRGAAFVVAIVVEGKGPISFDAGRAARTCCSPPGTRASAARPNAIADEPAARARSSSTTKSKIAIVLLFGYPAKTARPRESQRRRVERPREAAARSRRVVRRQ